MTIAHPPTAARPLPLRIVIAEDDGLIAMDLAELLRGMGHSICAIARTEAEAVAAARTHHPELMIVDGNLDGGSGYAAIQTILAGGPVAYLYLTGSPYEITRLARGAVVVAKPFSLQELEAGIDRARQQLAG